MPRIATLLLVFAQSSQAAALSDLLTKMEQYVVAYEGQLSTCVAIRAPSRPWRNVHISDMLITR